MTFIEACQAAYQKAVDKMIETKEDAAIDLYLCKEIADVQVWNTGFIQVYSTGILLQDLQSDEWEAGEWKATD